MELEGLRLDYKVPDDQLLDDNIVSELMSIVQNSSSLKSLSLPPYGLSKSSQDSIISMLKSNIVLEQLEYWFRIGNLYFPDTNEMIDYYLKLNRSGVRELQAHDNTTSLSQNFINALISHNEDIDVVYHMFNTNPSIIMSLIGDDVVGAH